MYGVESWSGVGVESWSQLFGVVFLQFSFLMCLKWKMNNING